MNIIIARNIVLPPFLFTVFPKYNNYLTNMKTKFAHGGSVYENIIRLEKHPVVEIYMPSSTFAFQSQNVVPTQNISVGNPLGHTNYIPCTANIGMVTLFFDLPDPF